MPVLRNNKSKKSIDSASISGKAKGNAKVLLVKYMQMARDAKSNNDTIKAEIFFQYAEHYNREINKSKKLDKNRQNEKAKKVNNNNKTDNPKEVNNNKTDNPKEVNSKIKTKKVETKKVETKKELKPKVEFVSSEKVEFIKG